MTKRGFELLVMTFFALFALMIPSAAGLPGFLFLSPWVFFLAPVLSAAGEILRAFPAVKTAVEKKE